MILTAVPCPAHIRLASASRKKYHKPMGACGRYGAVDGSFVHGRPVRLDDHDAETGPRRPGELPRNT